MREHGRGWMHFMHWCACIIRLCIALTFWNQIVNALVYCLSCGMSHNLVARILSILLDARAIYTRSLCAHRCACACTLACAHLCAYLCVRVYVRVFMCAFRRAVVCGCD